MCSFLTPTPSRWQRRSNPPPSGVRAPAEVSTSPSDPTMIPAGGACWHPTARQRDSSACRYNHGVTISNMIADPNVHGARERPWLEESKE